MLAQVFVVLPAVINTRFRSRNFIVTGEDMKIAYLFLGRGDGNILEGHETVCGLRPGQRGKELSAGLG